MCKLPLAIPIAELLSGREARPVADNATRAGYRRDRRVVIEALR